MKNPTIGQYVTCSGFKGIFQIVNLYPIIRVIDARCVTDEEDEGIVCKHYYRFRDGSTQFMLRCLEKL
jgi:hypothetical protein